MSTKPFDAALDFRDTETAREPGGWRRTLADVFQAIGEGLAAHRHYQMLVARGVPAGRAVEMTFNAIFGQR